ncbi:hypothetical protein C8Q76DRAFT_697850 [Earliella scabrosa]|nr:hypothetical protein C8Q76DRAFT_697850 [Earliella scabrosa]
MSASYTSPQTVPPAMIPGQSMLGILGQTLFPPVNTFMGDVMATSTDAEGPSIASSPVDQGSGRCAAGYRGRNSAADPGSTPMDVDGGNVTGAPEASGLSDPQGAESGIVVTYMQLQGGRLGPIQRTVTRAHLDVVFKFKAILQLLEQHASPNLPIFEYVFTQLALPRVVASTIGGMQAMETSAADPPVTSVTVPHQPAGEEHPDYLHIADAALKEAIITEWEQTISAISLADWPSKIDFQLLRNDYLPEHVLPVSYNRTLYGGAILHPKGLEKPQERGNLIGYITGMSDYRRM